MKLSELMAQSPEPKKKLKLSEVMAQQPQTEEVEERGTLQKIGDFFTGNDRATEQTDTLPELSEDSGLLFGEDAKKTAALMPVVMSTTDPNEIAKIITSNFDNVGLTYNLDAQGQPFPILVNNKTGAAAQVNRPGMSGLDVLQGLGLMAMFAPAGKAASITGAIAKNAGTEALIQGAQEVAGGDFDAADIALAGGLSGGLQAVGEGVSLAKRLATKVDDVTPEQGLVKLGDDAQIPVMTSDALPPQTFTGKTAQQLSEKIPFAGTGGVREGQQLKRMEAVTKLADDYGEFSYSSIIDSLKTQKDRIKKAAGNVLESTGNKLDEVGEIQLTSTRETLGEVIEELNKPGVIKNNSFMADIDELVKAIDEAPQSFTMAKENRTLFREIANGADKAERSQLTSRAKGLLKRVEHSLGKDMKAFAKEHLDSSEFAKWERANKAYADEAVRLTKTKLKNVLDKGDITPEGVDRMLFSKSKSDIDLLYKSLTPKGRDNARAAIISKAFDNMSRRQSGVTPNALVGELNKLGGQIDVFFKGAEKKRVLGLQRVLEATKRAQDAAVSTPTGQQLVGVAATGAAFIEPATLLAGGGAGLLSRFYESRAARNALLQLGSLPPRSSRFDAVLRETLGHLHVLAQSTKSGISATEDKEQRLAAR